MDIESVEQELDYRCDCCGGSFYEEDLFFDDETCTTICSLCDKYPGYDEEEQNEI